MLTAVQKTRGRKENVGNCLETTFYFLKKSSLGLGMRTELSCYCVQNGADTESEWLELEGIIKGRLLPLPAAHRDTRSSIP